MRSLLTVSATLILLISAAPLRADLVIDSFDDSGLEDLSMTRVYPAAMPSDSDSKSGISSSITAGGAREISLDWADGSGAASLTRTGGALDWLNSTGVQTNAGVGWGTTSGGSAIGAIPHNTLKWTMTSNVGGYDYLLSVLDGSGGVDSSSGYASDGVLAITWATSGLGIDWTDVDSITLEMYSSEGLSMSADSFTAMGVIPEPGTLTMALIGCACVGFVRRRRQPLSV